MTYTLSSNTSYPFNDVCYVTVDLNGEAFRGSGVIIGPHTVLTAAHMVYDSGTGASATNVEVFPGYSSSVDATSSQAHAGVTAIHNFTIDDAGGSQYTSSSAYDFAVIDFSTTFSSWLGVQTDYSGGAVTVAGYPAYPSGVETGPQSFRQWVTTGMVTADSSYNVLNYVSLVTQPGNSGGPLFVNEGTTATPSDYVVGVVSTGGWAGQLTDSTWQTISDWETADSSLWTTAGRASQAVTQFVAQQNAVRQSVGWTSNLEMAGITSSAGDNSVIGWESANLPSGHNAVVLDGQRSNYALQIDGSGQTVIHDLTTGQSIVVEGATYLLFNGASAQTAGTYDQIVFIEGGANGGQDAQMARLYEAAFGRQPDLPGLEAWQAQVDTGALTINQIAGDFIASSEFASRFGANPSDASFVAALYANVLGRPADQAGATAWTDYLQTIEAQYGGTPSGNLLARATVLLDFSNSQECLAKVASLLVDITKGGYADSGDLLDAATVLNQAAGDHYLNLNLIDPSSIPTKGVASYDYNPTSSTAAGSGFYVATGQLYVEGANNAIVLNNTITYAYLDGDGNTLNATQNTSNVDCYGSYETVVLASGSTTKVSAYLLSETIQHFTPGQNSLYSDINVSNQTEIMLDSSSGQMVQGSTLNFTQNFYILKVGSVNSGSAADVAAQANTVYTPAGTSAKGTEILEIIGQTNSGDTVIYQWGMGSSNPDTNGNHKIDAAELYQIATLVGVQTQTLTTHDLT